MCIQVVTILKLCTDYEKIYKESSRKCVVKCNYLTNNETTCTGKKTSWFNVDPLNGWKSWKLSKNVWFKAVLFRMKPVYDSI